MAMNSYELSRTWFDWCFENPNLISPNHTALYFFCIEHCNRLGWKEKFGLPTSMAKDAIGIRSYNTYINTLKKLVEWGFIKMIETSKNQYSSNIIAISKFNKATTKALDKALIKHGSKQRQSTSESISSIDKQINNITINKEQYYREFDHLKLLNLDFDKLLQAGYSKEQVDDILNRIENFEGNKKYKSLYLTSLTWLKKEPKNYLKNGNAGQKKVTPGGFGDL